MNDHHVVFICNQLALNCSTQAFASNLAYAKFQSFLLKYATSTAENYAWRVHNFLKKDNKFPFHLLIKYEALANFYACKYSKQ